MVRACDPALSAPALRRRAAGDKKLTVTSNVAFSKRYVKYLTKKFLKKNQLRDWLRVVATTKDTYALKFYNISCVRIRERVGCGRADVCSQGGQRRGGRRGVDVLGVSAVSLHVLSYVMLHPLVCTRMLSILSKQWRLSADQDRLSIDDADVTEGTSVSLDDEPEEL
jgi:hypothetical protein